jgi:electron transfer flavoprotein beta subunit
MKIIVPIKRVVDYNVRVRPTSDQTAVEISNAKMSMNPFDEIAVEEAIRLKEAGVASEVLVVSFGVKQCQETIRTALAMGADRGIFVETDEELQSLAVAKLLKAIVIKENPRMVILGKQAIDDDANQTGQMLAALLNWGQGTFACGVKVESETVIVTREIDGGTQTISLKLPAVITTDLRLNEPRYAKLPDTLTAVEMGVDISSKLKLLKVCEPPKREAGIIVADVAELLDKLRNEAKVI